MMLATASDATLLIEPLLRGRETEAVAVAYLGPDRELLHVRLSEGELDAANLHIRSILGEALRLGAVGLIIAHNHPSGDPCASEADLAATRRLAETAAAMGLRLHDHLIFGGGECCSLRALGLL